MTSAASKRTGHLRESTGRNNDGLRRGFSQLHIVDELLEERCVQLRKRPRLWAFCKSVVFPHLRIEDTKHVVDIIGGATCEEIMVYLRQELRLEFKLANQHLLPVEGPCILAANHPTGMIDALAIYFALSHIRGDFAIFSNRDAVRAAPALADILIPVEWMTSNRTRTRMRETLTSTRDALRNGKAVVIFPAGGIARITARGVRDQAWLETTVKMARKHQVPIVPLHVHARNSPLYYLLELLNTELRDLTRFREMFHKQDSVFEFTLGSPVEPAQLTNLPTRAATARLHNLVEFGLPRGKTWSST